jgi:hypothetical protein
VRIAEVLPNFPGGESAAYMTEPGSTPSFHKSDFVNDFPINYGNIYKCTDLIEFDVDPRLRRPTGGDSVNKIAVENGIEVTRPYGWKSL